MGAILRLFFRVVVDEQFGFWPFEQRPVVSIKLD
jgi:hypothetical protein